MSLFTPLAVPLAVVGITFVVVFLARQLARPAPLRYKPRLLMTSNELEFFHRIRRAALDGFVFPQVAMAGLIEPDGLSGKAYQTAFRRISQKRVDFVVYDSSMRLIAVIELDDRTHNSTQDAERDAKLLTAGVRTLRYQSKSKPNETKIQTDLVSIFHEQRLTRSMC